MFHKYPIPLGFGHVERPPQHSTFSGIRKPNLWGAPSRRGVYLHFPDEPLSGDETTAAHCIRAGRLPSIVVQDRAEAAVLGEERIAAVAEQVEVERLVGLLAVALDFDGDGLRCLAGLKVSVCRCSYHRLSDSLLLSPLPSMQDGQGLLEAVGHLDPRWPSQVEAFGHLGPADASP